MLTEAVYERASLFQHQGVMGMDSVHLAACEAIGVDVFATCDDRLLRWCRRNAHTLPFRVVNPTELIDE
jgi:predicted nucleic acid-binding protein